MKSKRNALDDGARSHIPQLGRAVSRGGQELLAVGAPAAHIFNTSESAGGGLAEATARSTHANE